MIVKEFLSKHIQRDELILDWNNIYLQFVDKFNNSFQYSNKKLHFDFIRSKKDLTHTHVDGAKYNWIDPILLDTVLCLISNIIPSDHRSRRRTFDQQKVLLDCVVEALNMDDVNQGWNSVALRSSSKIYETSSAKSRKKKNYDEESDIVLSTDKINTRGRTSLTSSQREAENIKMTRLTLRNLPETWYLITSIPPSLLSSINNQHHHHYHHNHHRSNSENFAKENDKITKSKKKRNEICDVLLKEIASREETLPNVVIDALVVLLSTDFEEYYRNYKPDNVIEVTSNNKKKRGRSSKRKNAAATIETNAAGMKNQKRRKRTRSNGNATSNATSLIEETQVDEGDDVGLLDPFDLALDEYFVYENTIGTRNSSDSSNLSFDDMELKDESPPKQQSSHRTHKTRSNSV